MKITYTQDQDIIIGFVRISNPQGLTEARFTVRLSIKKGLTQWYFEDDQGESYGKHPGYSNMSEVLHDIESIRIRAQSQITSGGSK